MIVSLLLALAAQDGSQDPAVQRHITCVRVQERGPDVPGGPKEGFMPSSEHLPIIVEIAGLLQFCHRERSQAIASLRAAFRRAHPDWAEDRLSRAAEIVLTRRELERLQAAVAPLMTSHSPIEDF